MLRFPRDHFGDKVKMYEETGGTPPPQHTFLRGGLIYIRVYIYILIYIYIRFLQVHQHSEQTIKWKSQAKFRRFRFFSVKTNEAWENGWEKNCESFV